MLSNFWNKITGSEHRNNQEGEGFPLFPNLPPELRAMVWKHAVGEPRLIYVQVSVPGSGAFARFDRMLMNRNHLTETSQPSGVLYACHESRAEALDGAQRDVSSINWLSMLGVLEFHPNASDLVYLGGLRDKGRTPPADMNRIIPLSLVLGNILPRVCVNGDVFARYFAREMNKPDDEDQQPPENPIEKGLASLRSLNTQFAPLFANTPAGLPHPRLPESMVLMLDNFHLRWSIVSPCTDPAHTEAFIVSCCIHYEHLEIIADADIDVWMDANLSEYDADRANRIREEIVPSIRAIWAGWRSRPDVANQVPRLFFTRIRPSWVFVDEEEIDHPVPADGESQDPEA